MFFSHLNVEEIIQLLGDDFSSTLEIDEFSMLSYKFINDCEDFPMLNDYDPEVNNLCNIIRPSSDYCTQYDFEQLLATNKLPTAI